MPCVVKVSSSSSGDGVRVCRMAQDISSAQAVFADLRTPILIQEYIDAVWNCGIQFGIPANPTLPIDIIGMSRQVTSPNGEFLGGIVLYDDQVPDELVVPLQESILPRARERGWFGIGGIDVLRNTEGRYYLHRPELSYDGYDRRCLCIDTTRSTAEHVGNDCTLSW